MENTKIIFCSSKEDDHSEMQAYINTQNELFITIENELHQFSYITLNRETAIKFVKHLKKEISYMIESEEENG